MVCLADRPSYICWMEHGVVYMNQVSCKWNALFVINKVVRNQFLVQSTFLHMAQHDYEGHKFRILVMYCAVRIGDMTSGFSDHCVRGTSADGS